MLTILESLDDEVLLLPAEELHTRLPGPVLVHLKGRKQPALFASVLLHGNEHTGWEAVRKCLLGSSGRELPRDFSLYIGNVQAARYGKRYLDEQRDFNRVWEGNENSPEHEMMRTVVEQMKQRGVFGSIDIHNNSGKNPHYACVNRTDNKFLQLGSLFSRTMVYFTRPRGVQSMAFAQFCPAVTVECGLSGEKSGIDHACEFIDACMHIEKLPERTLGNRDIDLYHTVATVKIMDDHQFGFDHKDYDLWLDRNIEYFNFRELPRGSCIGKVNSNKGNPLIITDEQGEDVSQDYFSIIDGDLISNREIIPAMITLNTDVIKKDCLCYLMEHYPLPE